MNFFRFRITLVFLFVFAFCSSAFASGDSIFYCNTPTSGVRTVPAGQQTLTPVAIYARGTDARFTNLPNWYATIWDTTNQTFLSVPRFFRDNSLGKYIMKPRAFGLNGSLCFTLSLGWGNFDIPPLLKLYAIFALSANRIFGEDFGFFFHGLKKAFTTFCYPYS